MSFSTQERMEYLDEVDRRTSKLSLSEKEANKITDAFSIKALNDPQGTILFGGNRDSHTLWGMACILRAARWKDADTEYVHKLQQVTPFDGSFDIKGATDGLKSIFWTDLAALQTPLIHEQEENRSGGPRHNHLLRHPQLQKGHCGSGDIPSLE